MTLGASSGIRNENGSVFCRLCDGIEYLKNAVELRNLQECHHFFVNAHEDYFSAVAAHLTLCDKKRAKAGTVAELDIRQVDDQ